MKEFIGEFELSKYADVTEFAKSYNSEYKTYEKILVCVDVHDFWIARILKGYRYDEDEGYVRKEDSYILERNNISKRRKENITSEHKLKIVLSKDDFSNWDCENCESEDDALMMLDGGYGFCEVYINKNG